MFEKKAEPGQNEGEPEPHSFPQNQVFGIWGCLPSGSSVPSGSIQLDDESIIWRERVGRYWTTDLRSFKVSRDCNQLGSAFFRGSKFRLSGNYIRNPAHHATVNVVTNCVGLQANMPATVISFSPVGPNAGLKNVSFVPNLP